MTQEILQQALDAFEVIFETTVPYRDDGECTFSDNAKSTANKAIAAIEAAIAQPATNPWDKHVAPQMSELASRVAAHNASQPVEPIKT